MRLVFEFALGSILLYNSEHVFQLFSVTSKATGILSIPASTTWFGVPSIGERCWSTA